MIRRVPRRAVPRALAALALAAVAVSLPHAPSASAGAPLPPSPASAPPGAPPTPAGPLSQYSDSPISASPSPPSFPLPFFSQYSSTSSPGDAPPRIPFSTTATSSMSTVRWLHVAVPMTDGRVLVAGGQPTGDSGTSAEIYDPVTGLWTRTSKMVFYHDWPVGAPMCDNRVFVAGRNSTAREAEIYDPVQDVWTDAGQMKFSHLYGQATLLQDCRILLTGGYDANTRAEIYDPATGAFSAIIGSMSSERFFHTATRLADGRVLVAGGGVDAFGTWYTYKTADIWDPATGKWTKRKSMLHSRRAHTATLLLDGRVLVAGGTEGGKNDGTEGGTQLDTAEIYDPAADVWAPLDAKLVTPRGLHTAALLPSGAVLLLGGLDATGSATREVEVLYEGVWTRLDPLIVDRFHHASAQLADGRVLVAGGVHQATAELYALGQPGDPCLTGATCAGSLCANGVCCDEPCDGGCRRCDVPGREGTCALPCADADHALACSDGTTTCGEEACVAVPCSPYRCDAEQGACRAGCVSVEDCAPGYACGLEGTCIPPPDVSAGAACAAAPAAPSRGVAALLTALTAALSLVYKRRHLTKRAAQASPHSGS